MEKQGKVDICVGRQQQQSNTYAKKSINGHRKQSFVINISYRSKYRYIYKPSTGHIQLMLT